MNNEFLKIGEKVFTSRLMLGTGRFDTETIRAKAIEESKCEIVTVAVRRIEKLTKNNKSTFLKNINWKKIWLLPNTSGAQTAEEAIRLAYLGRELAKQLGQDDNNFVKLEVISDKKYLLPDPLGTFKAAKFLVDNGFTVLPYINADLILAKHLEDIGCSAIMPLGSPIGSGQGLKNLYNLQLFSDEIRKPLILDAGIGKPSDATVALEIGFDGILLNTAIAKSKNPPLMARAMALGVEAGRLSFISGQMKKVSLATPSSTPKGQMF